MILCILELHAVMFTKNTKKNGASPNFNEGSEEKQPISQTMNKPSVMTWTMKILPSCS